MSSTSSFRVFEEVVDQSHESPLKALPRLEEVTPNLNEYQKEFLKEIQSLRELDPRRRVMQTPHT
jgi:hypothetical protein